MMRYGHAARDNLLPPTIKGTGSLLDCKSEKFSERVAREGKLGLIKYKVYTIVALTFGNEDRISTYSGVKVNWRHQLNRDLGSA